MSFSMLYFSMACVAQSTASCCMSSDMSAFFITAFRSVMVALHRQREQSKTVKRMRGYDPILRRCHSTLVVTLKVDDLWIVKLKPIGRIPFNLLVSSPWRPLHPSKCPQLPHLIGKLPNYGAMVYLGFRERCLE